MNAGQLWTRISTETCIPRDVVKGVAFCLVYGHMGDTNLFDLGRKHKLDVSQIARIRGYIDEFLTGG